MAYLLSTRDHINRLYTQVFSACVVVFLLLLFPGVVFAVEDDTTPPELVEVNLSPVSIDVTSSSALVTLTATITDDLSGFSYGYFYLYSPSNSQEKYIYIAQLQRVSGTSLNGQYETTITFPQFSEAGVWTLSYAYLYDVTTNRRYYYEADLAALGSTSVSVTSNEDTTPLEITSIEFSPTLIDVSAGDVSVTVTAAISDDLAGFDYGYLYFYSPTNNQYKYAYLGNRISGDAFSGIYQETVTFPQYSEAGNWRISYMYLYDNADNEWYYYEQNLIDAGLSTKISIVANPQDIQPPQLSELTFSPEVVNTILSPASATFFLGLTDDLSGFSSASLGVTSPSGGQNQYLYPGSYDRTSGDALSGTYQRDKEFPRYSEFGEWKIRYLYLYDRTTNRHYYSTQNLEALGFPTIIKMEGIIHDGSGNYVVGPGGGTLQTNDGTLTVDIPEGALSQDTDISITRVGRFDPVNILVGDGLGLGQSVAEYNFDPDGLEFAEPVTVTIVVDVTSLNQNQRDRLDVYLNTDTDGNGTLDTFVPLSGDQIISVTTMDNPDGTTVMTFVLNLEHFSTYSVIYPIESQDTTPPTVNVLIPEEGGVIQDGVALVAEVTDENTVNSVHFTIREADGNEGTPIGYEDITATQEAGTDLWKFDFNSSSVVDGHYIGYAKAIDEHGNEGMSSTVHFSIRNWAVVELLPASEEYQSGRTMPVKFALRIAKSVNPNMPFVRNEKLEIKIYDTSKPDEILQSSRFGDKAMDYRIKDDTEVYITNFRTDRKPTSYTVEIWRPANQFLVGEFVFETVRK